MELLREAKQSVQEAESSSVASTIRNAIQEARTSPDLLGQEFFSILHTLINSRPEILEGCFFDITESLIFFLHFPTTHDFSRQVLQIIAGTCNCREVIILLSEELVKASQTVNLEAARVILELLGTVILRVPLSRRASFFESILPLILSTFSFRTTEPADDATQEEAGIQVRNVFGDTEEESRKKYGVNSGTIALLSNCLDFVHAVLPQETHQKNVDTGLAKQQRLLLRFLLSLLEVPIARIPSHLWSAAMPSVQKLWVALKLLGVNLFYLLNQKVSENENGSQQQYGGKLQLSLAGTACLLYISITEQETLLDPGLCYVLNPYYLFLTSLPFIARLLRDPAPNAAYKGFVLLNRFISVLEPSVILLDFMSECNCSLSKCCNFAKDLITFMVNYPVEEYRQRTYRYLILFISLFPEKVRYILLGRLIHECPYYAVSGLLINHLKQEVQLAMTMQRSGESSPFFASPKLLDLFPFCLDFSGGNTLEKYDVLMNAANFYRFLLLRTKKHDCLGVWKPEALQLVRQQFLQPLNQTLTKQIKETTESLDENEQKKAITAMTKYGFPKLSEAQVEEASVATLSSLNLLKEVVDRIEDILKDQ